MRFEGALVAWNAERGRGEIAPEQGGQTIFVHVSAFPHGGPAPTLGEALSFEVVSGSDGRKQAARVMRSKRVLTGTADRLLAPPPRRPWRELKRERRRRIGLALAGLLVVVVALGWIELSKPGHRFGQQGVGSEMAVN